MSLRRDRSTSKRGLAMLMALATVVLVMTGMTAGLVALHGARQSAWTSAVDGHLLGGLRQGERLASAWLKAHGDDAVLPPEGGGILLVDDHFILPSGEGRLTVVAYDGLAGLPASLAQAGSGLRAALPAAMVELLVPRVNPTQPERSAHLVASLDLPEHVPRFPQRPSGRGRVWRTPGAGHPSEEDLPAASGPSLAETIAFRSDGRININTAPEALLRTAYAVLELEGVEEVLARRRSLQPSRAPVNAADATGLRLVAESDRWQMLIAVSWQGIRRSWWADFDRLNLVQRHAIAE